MEGMNMLRQFKKFGSLVILLNMSVIFIILTIAYPVFSDFRILLFLMALVLVSSIGIYLYFMYMVNSILRLTDDIETNHEKLRIVFKKNPRRVMAANILVVCVFYAPTIPVLYFFFGYTNLYYHFFIFFVNVSVIIFLGYNSVVVWYTRTYPLGRFNIPVAVQGLGSKIISLVFPNVLLVSAIISVFLFFMNATMVQGVVNNHIRDALSCVSSSAAKQDGPGDMIIPSVFTSEKGVLIVIGADGRVVFSSDSSLEGEKITDTVDRGRRLQSEYRETLEYLENPVVREKPFRGVYSGSSAVFFVKNMEGNNQKILGVFNEKKLYNDFYKKTFIEALALFLINLGIGLWIYRKLLGMARSLKQSMPALTRASNGDLSVDINLVKTRDILEDFTRTFMNFITMVRDFIVSSQDMADRLIHETESISTSGSHIKELASRNAERLNDSTQRIEGIAGSFTSIARNASQQNSNIEELDEAIRTLSSSMEQLGKDANNVINSMTSVENEAQESTELVNQAFQGMKETYDLYGGIQEVTLIISDIAEQVNLLSLNASIEAARAGEQGRGFAVVAEEISKLADRTGANVQQITNLINQGNEGITRNMEIITKVRDTYGSIVNSIETTGFMIAGFIDMINSRAREIDNIKNHVASVSEFSHDLSRSTGEQDENTATVSDTIRTVNEGAREFVEQSEKLSELSEELRKMALSLIEKQKQFKL